MEFKEMLSKILHLPPKRKNYAYTFNGFTPIFSQFGTDIYASDVVKQAIKCIVDEMKKLNPTHVVYKDNDPTPQKSQNGMARTTFSSTHGSGTSGEAPSVMTEATRN